MSGLRYLVTVSLEIRRVLAIFRTDQFRWCRRWISNMVALSSMGNLLEDVGQGFADTAEWFCRCFGRQFQHLEDSSVKGDKLFFNQAVSGLDVPIQVQGQMPADGIVAVKRQSITIRCQHQKQVQQKLGLGHGG
jgi:hypothetical protein